jgi:hypothetical protein
MILGRKMVIFGQTLCETSAVYCLQSINMSAENPPPLVSSAAEAGRFPGSDSGVSGGSGIGEGLLICF